MIEDLARWVDTLPALGVFALSATLLGLASTLNYLWLRRAMLRAERAASVARTAAATAAKHSGEALRHLNAARRLTVQHQERKRALRRSVARGEVLVPTRRTDGMHRAGEQ